MYSQDSQLVRCIIRLLPTFDYVKPLPLLRLISAFFCLGAIFLSFSAWGQDPEPPKESPFDVKSYERFLWGFRAGINVTTSHFEDPDARKALESLPGLGWTIGTVAQFKLSNRFAFQAELGYTQKTHRFTFDNGSNENKMDMSFLDISLLLRRRFSFEWGKNIRSDVFIGAGPNINYWLDTKGTIITAAAETPYNIIINGTPDANYNNMYFNGVNNWLFGIDLGVGINAPITARQKVFVEFRAHLGQTNLGGKTSTANINLVGFAGSPFQQNILQSNLKTFSISASYTFSFNYLESKMGKSNKKNMVKKRKPAKRKRR